ncbi:Werner Syndrome-like exonuclease [Cucumis sativus]|uniref:3'-5' exonuclease domain-containing protein n=1 Tax=Cucumis sativus TaxID=3659 RepID=A0A0A0LFG2_CUCSA|nr:Werner Syndrome-like exonuclease [Cucumis sativus]
MPILLNITDLHIPYYTHDYYDITIDDDEILTLRTASIDVVNFWVATILEVNNRRIRPLIVGLDIEWRPYFGPKPNPVATLQLCVGHRCLIFQLLYCPAAPQALVNFLFDSSCTFVGVGIHQDVQKLYHEYGLTVSNVVDLRDLAVNKLGRTYLRYAGLKSLWREVLGREIEKPKYITLSNWDSVWLNYAQILYATIDAFISFEIGRSLMNL